VLEQNFSERGVSFRIVEKPVHSTRDVKEREVLPGPFLIKKTQGFGKLRIIRFQTLFMIGPDTDGQLHVFAHGLSSPQDNESRHPAAFRLIV
jgi:hypothetical protein